MSNNLREEKLLDRKVEPAVASEVFLDTNAPPDDASVEEIEETTFKSKIEDFAAKFRRPVESARDQKSGDRVRGALILVATSIGCLFLFFGLFTTSTDSSKKERKTQPTMGRPLTDGVTAETAN